MGHTNQTANYNLPQFVGADKPSWLGDINDAFAAIDTAIAAAASEASTADGKADALTTTVSGHTTQIGTLQNTVTSQGNTLNTVTSLIGNGTPTTTDQTIIGGINELHADQGDLTDLQTTDKSSLVGAINEVAQSGGGGSQSVRYYNGYIQYSTDGGTTWINLINVSTPQQLLPTMTSSTSPAGTLTANLGGSTSPLENTPYIVVDGSGSTISNYLRIADNTGDVTFTFSTAQYVKYAQIYAFVNSGQTSVVKVEAKIGGSWIEVGRDTVTTTTGVLVTGNINNTAEAIRVRCENDGANLYQLEAYN